MKVFPKAIFVLSTHAQHQASLNLMETCISAIQFHSTNNIVKKCI